MLDLALDVLQRLKPAVRRDEGDQSEDHDAHKHPRQRAAPPRPLLRLHGYRRRGYVDAAIVLLLWWWAALRFWPRRVGFSPQASVAIGLELVGLGSTTE